jgi:hypothetical protein
MNRLLLLGLICALTAAPVAAAPPPAGGHGEAEAAKPDPQASRITGSPNYIPTFGLRASITRGTKVNGVISVDAGVDVPDAKVRKKVEATKPRLMSAMRDAVLAYVNLSYTVGDRPDADMLKARMQKAVDNVLGPGQAKVTLASVVIFK